VKRCGYRGEIGKGGNGAALGLHGAQSWEKAIEQRDHGAYRCGSDQLLDDRNLRLHVSTTDVLEEQMYEIVRANAQRLGLRDANAIQGNVGAGGAHRIDFQSGYDNPELRELFRKRVSAVNG